MILIYIYIYINHPPCLCHWDISLSTKSLQRGQELDVVLGHDVHSLQGSKLILESNGKATSMLRDSKTKFPRIPDKLKKNTRKLIMTIIVFWGTLHLWWVIGINLGSLVEQLVPQRLTTPAAPTSVLKLLQHRRLRSLKDFKELRAQKFKENCLTQRQSLGALKVANGGNHIPITVYLRETTPQDSSHKLWIQPFSHLVVEAVRRRSKLWRSDPSRSRSRPSEEGSYSLFLCLFHLPALKGQEVKGDAKAEEIDSKVWECWEWFFTCKKKNIGRSAPLSGPFLWCYSIQSLPCQRQKRSCMQSASQQVGVMHSLHV